MITLEQLDATLDKKLGQLSLTFDSKLGNLEKKFELMGETLDARFGSIDARFELMSETFDKKLVKLNEKLDTKFAEQYDDLAGMMARGLTELRNEFKEDLTATTNKWELMLDTHIDAFRKDYNELAPRVKNLELAIKF
ncbi:hypothetical protein H0X32_00950 [Patescibacteria group bacterium]|nr:hypothetical protein [Patescibacteria group bacterium]